jgi:hypothetical protein
MLMLALSKKPVSILNDSMNSVLEAYPTARFGDPFKEQRYTGGLSNSIPHRIDLQKKVGACNFPRDETDLLYKHRRVIPPSKR